MKLIYTYTDEAPALATHSFLPIIEAFAGQAGIDIELRDISLAGRILAQFPDRLTDEQRVADALAELGELAKTPEANIIKLPNISASIPQLKSAIKELQDAGYDVPDYPDNPTTDAERAAREAYDRVKGSAVNPVLREGNSDRRAPASVKSFARSHPHSMGAWSKDSKSHVSTMSDGDFRSTEQSVTIDRRRRAAHRVRRPPTAPPTVLKASIPVLAGEIVDARGDAARRAGRLPGRADRRGQGAGRPLLPAHEGDDDEGLGPDHLRPRRAGVLRRRVRRSSATRCRARTRTTGWRAILVRRLARARGARSRPSLRDRGPALAMVDSDRGITNLHVPSDVIIDASMPAMIRTSGQMWNAAGRPAGRQGRHP